MCRMLALYFAGLSLFGLAIRVADVQQHVALIGVFSRFPSSAFTPLRLPFILSCMILVISGCFYRR
jgi:hypothetical protein